MAGFSTNDLRIQPMMLLCKGIGWPANSGHGNVLIVETKTTLNQVDLGDSNPIPCFQLPCCKWENSCTGEKLNLSLQIGPCHSYWAPKFDIFCWKSICKHHEVSSIDVDFLWLSHSHGSHGSPFRMWDHCQETRRGGVHWFDAWNLWLMDPANVIWNIDRRW